MNEFEIGDRVIIVNSLSELNIGRHGTILNIWHADYIETDWYYILYDTPNKTVGIPEIYGKGTNVKLSQIQKEDNDIIQVSKEIIKDIVKLTARNVLEEICEPIQIKSEEGKIDKQLVVKKLGARIDEIVKKYCLEEQE